MTPKQLQNLSTIDLVKEYKNKARCYHSEGKSVSIYNELEKRLGVEKLYNLRLETFHMQNGEGDATFNNECDNLIKELLK